MYGVTISHALIAQVTDAVLEEACARQTPPLESIRPTVWLDGIVAKVQQNKLVINKSVHVALGVNLRGEEEVLGLWIAQTEGAKFWLHVVAELKNRGAQEVFNASVDGLKRFPKRSRRYIPRPQCSFASCICCATG